MGQMNAPSEAQNVLVAWDWIRLGFLELRPATPGLFRGDPTEGADQAPKAIAFSPVKRGSQVEIALASPYARLVMEWAYCRA